MNIFYIVMTDTNININKIFDTNVLSLNSLSYIEN